jgi:hypothetical protein
VGNRPWTRRLSPRRAAWYPSRDQTTVSLDWLLSSLNTSPNRVRPPAAGMASLPWLSQPCEIVLSGARGSNGRVLHVRCRCMSGVRGRNFFAYDAIGQAVSIPQAVEMWKEAGHGQV